MPRTVPSQFIWISLLILTPSQQGGYYFMKTKPKLTPTQLAKW